MKLEFRVEWIFEDYRADAIDNCHAAGWIAHFTESVFHVRGFSVSRRNNHLVVAIDVTPENTLSLHVRLYRRDSI